MYWTRTFIIRGKNNNEEPLSSGEKTIMKTEIQKLGKENNLPKFLKKTLKESHPNSEKKKEKIWLI